MEWGRYSNKFQGVSSADVTLSSEWVYFILSGSFLKIGYSSDLLERVKTYVTGNPDFKLVAVIPGSRELEKKLHSRFDAYRHRTEWFRFEGELVEFVQYVVRSLRHGLNPWRWCVRLAFKEAIVFPTLFCGNEVLLRPYLQVFDKLCRNGLSVAMERKLALSESPHRRNYNFVILYSCAVCASSSIVFCEILQ